MGSRQRRRLEEVESGSLPAKLARTPTNIVHSWRSPAGDISETTARSIANRQLDLEKTNKYLRCLVIVVIVCVGFLLIGMLALNIAAIKITQSLFADSSSSNTTSIMTDSRGAPVSTVSAVFDANNLDNVLYMSYASLRGLESVAFELYPSNTVVYMRISTVQKTLAGDVIAISPAGERFIGYVNRTFVFIGTDGVQSDVFSNALEARLHYHGKRSHKPSSDDGFRSPVATCNSPTDCNVNTAPACQAAGGASNRGEWACIANQCIHLCSQTSY